jgi:hypothetical protein
MFFLLQEEIDLQFEVEKLDRERNLHIREMKRLQHEDDSRYAFFNYVHVTSLLYLAFSLRFMYLFIYFW